MYTSKDILKIAKRNHNTKRQYLLVNPLQAKHIPVDPNKCLNMMRELGKQLYDEFNNIGLIIGFAETATAIGNTIAAMSPDTIYISTTREEVEDVDNWIYFKEEHSHAVDQKLCADSLGSDFKYTDTVVFIDDELSTGKTVKNIILALKDKYPILNSKKIVAASIINRMSDENISSLKDIGVECRWLVKVKNESYDEYINSLNILEPVDVKSISINKSLITDNNCKNDIMLKDIRTGIYAYNENRIIDNKMYSMIPKTAISMNSKVLVLGTEEFMYPAIMFAKKLADLNPMATVRTHSTTRSPIGIVNENNYPIKNGYKISSFYEDNRDTFIYNLEYYDKVFILTDSNAHINIINKAFNDLVYILSNYYKCKDIYFIKCTAI